MYEFQYLFEARSNGGISHHKFFIDNVEVTHARTNLAHEYSTSSHGQLLQTYKWIIDCNASSNNAAAGAFTWTTPKTEVARETIALLTALERILILGGTAQVIRHEYI